MCYTLLVDEFVRQGMDVETAISSSSDWARGMKRDEEMTSRQRDEIPDNDASLAQLEAMLSGVSVR